MEIVLASRNVHKMREFRIMLSPIPGLDIDSLLSYPDYTPPEETGETFEENAEVKAVHAAQTLGKIVLADDSGIVVPVLDGAPGVYSRRYAGDDATDRENRMKLLEELKGKSGVQRQAYFECSLVIAGPEGVLKKARGRVEGYIAEEEKGRNGFGYDTIFVKHDYDKSFGELTDDVKNRISHRRKAIDVLFHFLESMVSKEQFQKSSSKNPN
jgi:XTP/dITP diphosphohydrolase